MSRLAQSSPAGKISYLRISLTERCNFRCLYCRDGGASAKPRELTPEEIELVVKVFSEFGLKSVRFTGGEPLLREDATEVVARVVRWVEDTALTTNGFFLDKFARPLRDAGLRRLNVSLDALNPDKFKKLTGGDLEKVLKGLKAALRAGFEEIKLNAVAIRGFTEEEVEPLLKFSAEGGFHLRFIELMPIGSLPFFEEDRFLPAERIRALIEEKYGKLLPLGRGGSGASKDYFLPSLGIKVGFIGAVSEPFCEGCEKFRLTADGKLRLCLRTDGEVDLKPYLPDGERLRSFVPKLLELKAENNTFLAKNGFGWFAGGRTMVSLGG